MTFAPAPGQFDERAALVAFPGRRCSPQRAGETLGKAIVRIAPLRAE
jgi:hypothetical protein